VGCGVTAVDAKSNASSRGYITIAASWSTAERYPENFLGLIHLASAIILLRH